MSADLRTRVLDATFAEVAAHGLEGLTVEAVAARAGSSRATIYRHFPGGRDELVGTTIRREVERFATDLTSADTAETDVVGRVSDLLARSRRLLSRHEVLQALLEDEAEALVPSLATVQPIVHEMFSSLLRDAFEGGRMADGVEIDSAADHCARMLLSYVGASGSWDLTDPLEVDTVVRTRILAGVVAPTEP